MEKRLFQEDIAVSKPYRAGYLASVQGYVESERAKAMARRDAFMPPEKLAEAREDYRRQFCEMLGRPLSEYASYRDAPVKELEKTYVGEDDESEIYRLRLLVTEGYEMYGVLFLPRGGVTADTPFLFSQHGNLGTPEYCSDFCGGSNYNRMTRRLTERGAVVFAPQLLMWNMEAYGDPFDRRKLDSDLKQVGSSMTALEVFGLMRCLDYFVTQPYCNPDHIGMIGLSYGGFFTLMTAAADPRIRSAYASCSFVDMLHFNWSDWTWKNSANTFLGAEIAALIAPRAIAFDAGDRDAILGSESTKKEYARAKTYFEAQGVGDHIFLKTFDGPHELDAADDGMDFLFAHL